LPIAARSRLASSASPRWKSWAASTRPNGGLPRAPRRWKRTSVSPKPSRRVSRRIEWLPPRELIESAVQRFYTHPLQTWLTLIGLFVGTAAIIVVVALGLTGRSFVMAQIEGVGSHLLWAQYLGTASAGAARKLDDQVRDTDAVAIAGRRDLFTGVTPLAVLHGEVAVQARSVALTVLGTTAHYPQGRKNLRVL